MKNNIDWLCNSFVNEQPITECPLTMPSHSSKFSRFSLKLEATWVVSKNTIISEIYAFLAQCDTVSSYGTLFSLHASVTFIVKEPFLFPLSPN